MVDELVFNIEFNNVIIREMMTVSYLPFLLCQKHFLKRLPLHPR